MSLPAKLSRDGLQMLSFFGAIGEICWHFCGNTTAERSRYCPVTAGTSALNLLPKGSTTTTSFINPTP
jgi:hypothetical protein